MSQGSLYFTLRTAEEALPVPRASVTLTLSDGTLVGEDEVLSDNGAVSRRFFVPAPPAAESLTPARGIPYATCDAFIRAEGYYSVRIVGLQIFDGEDSHVPLEMIPRGKSEDRILEYDIAPHALVLPAEEQRTEFDTQERVLREVFIPDRITVHLGRPQSNAANVNVSFIDYIKNVASSEIYPTWPRESLRANILCQISLALNRVFTEWYPSRGFAFNITNSTAYDQYFVYGRNIYESISREVDLIFNSYLRRPGRIDPYYAEYCDGATVTCAGLSQWGTVTLAREGRTAQEIVQFYYGDVEVVSTDRIRAIESSWGGIPLTVGSSGRDVRILQRQLNRICINYPALPVIEVVDGVFGEKTRRTVVAFQEVFDLVPDGIVGKSTWYRVSYIYVAVKKLAELNSEGELPQYGDETYPGLLKRGDTGTSVQTLQFYLKSAAAFNPFLATVDIDGFFGAETENAVRQFQRLYGLFEDGIVGQQTWERIVRVYRDVTDEGRITLREYPDRLLLLGSEGNDVAYVQRLLARLRRVFVTLPSLTVDGIYGERTRLAVREFQRLFGLVIDGVVGKSTWDRLNRIYGSVASGCLDNGEERTGRILRYGSSGADVTEIQRQLNTAASALAPLPTVTPDGLFGGATERAVRRFQDLFGLGSDGVVGNRTRTRLYYVSRGINSDCFPTRFREAAPLETGEESVETRAARAAVSLWPEGCPWREET